MFNVCLNAASKQRWIFFRLKNTTYIWLFFLAQNCKKLQLKSSTANCTLFVRNKREIKLICMSNAFAWFKDDMFAIRMNFLVIPF